MFSKKTRNLTVAVLALVMALTLSFGLFGFNTMQANAADFYSDIAGATSVEKGDMIEYTHALINSGKLKNNKFYFEVPTATSSGTLQFTDAGSNSSRYCYVYSKGVETTTRTASEEAVLNSTTPGRWSKYSGSGKTHVFQFNADDVLTLNGKYYWVIGSHDDYKFKNDFVLTTQKPIVTVTVTYDANGGECATTSAEFTIGGTALTLPTTTRTGYAFDGWYNGSTKVGDAGASYEPTANVTLTAQWTANTYTVTLDNGTTVTATYGQPLPDVAVPTKEDGSLFTGYYDAEGNQYYYDNGTSAVETYTLTTDLALTAHWISADITFTASWKWNADGTAELTLTGSDGSIVTPDNAENVYTENVTLAPTCTTVGSKDVTVKHTYNGKEYTGSATVEISASGHTMTAIAAVAPTCEVAGNNAYYYCETCKLYFKDEAGNTETTVEAEVIPATGHDYNVEPAWTVAGTTATATFTCKNGCGATHVETAEITETVVDPTETELGYKGQAATVTLNGNVYDYSSSVSEFIYHTTNEKMYAAQFVDVPVLSAYTYPEGWELTQPSDTKGDDFCHYMGVDVYPLHLGNKVTPHGQITYTMPTAKNIEKIVVFAANLSDSKKTSMIVQIKDANGASLYQTPTNISINGSKQIAAYTVTPDAVANNAKQVLITNGTGNAKLSVLEVCIYYAPDYNVTVVDGANTTTNGVYGASYTLPAQAGVEGYTNLGWTDGANLYKAGDVVTLTADTTVTALYAKLAFVGGSIRTTGTTGVRYMFELELYNVTDAAVMDYVASTISGNFNLQTSQANAMDIAGYKVNGNKIAMNAVVVNALDATANEADKTLCTTNIVATINVTVAGTSMNLTADGISMAYIAEVALGRNEIDLTLAQKYGYVAQA